MMHNATLRDGFFNKIMLVIDGRHSKFSDISVYICMCLAFA